MDKASTQGNWVYLPDPVSVTLTPKSGVGASADSFGSPVTVLTARKRPLTQEVISQLKFDIEVSSDWCLWSLWDRGEGHSPKVGDKITGPDAVVWLVRAVTVKIFGNLFSCLSQKKIVET